MLASLLIRFRILIIVTMIFLVGGSIFLLPHLKVDFRVSTFFPKGDVQLDFYQDYCHRQTLLNANQLDNVVKFTPSPNQLNMPAKPI